jgi:hypothetical protein
MTTTSILPKDRLDRGLFSGTRWTSLDSCCVYIRSKLVPGEQPQSALIRKAEPEVAVNPCGERLHLNVEPLWPDVATDP